MEEEEKPCGRSCNALVQRSRQLVSAGARTSTCLCRESSLHQGETNTMTTKYHQDPPVSTINVCLFGVRAASTFGCQLVSHRSKEQKHEIRAMPNEQFRRCWKLALCNASILGGKVIKDGIYNSRHSYLFIIFCLSKCAKHQTGRI